MADLVVEGLPEQKKPWLTLRDDLVLMPGPRAYDGSPTWTLYDPAVHRYFRIGWLEFECLHRWKLADAEDIAAAIEHETPIEVSVPDIEQFIQFLIKNQLTKPQGREASSQFAYMHHAGKPGFWTWLLHNYLFMRIPLLKPDRYLQKALPFIDWFFRRSFIVLLMLGACLAIFLVAQRWTEFSHSFMYTFTPEGILATVGMMSLSKVIHELGHAFAASHFGCRVPAMGVALLLGMPVLWTDVTDAWRLTKRTDRLIIDSAGMIAELSLAIIATLLWTMLPDGPLRSGSYLLASTAWVITLGINLNPFMRFDGYYLIVDAFDIPNLQDRSFTLAKWQLRESLFGFNIPAPEIWPKRRQQLIVLYAYSIWVYRLILFTGIAFLVYHFFFKLLGLGLFAVEIGWFIILPIARELAAWRQMIAETKTTIKPKPSWLVPIVLLGLLFIPWQSHLIVPGILQAEAEYTLYCIEPAQVQDVLVKEGENVQANQILVKLRSPDLDHKIHLAQLKVNELSERLSSHSLELKLAKDEPLGIIKNPAVTVTAYVEEADLAKLQPGGEGRFYPEGGDLSPQAVNIIAIDHTGTRELKIEELASVHGGEIAVRPDKEKNHTLVPEQGIYRILMTTDAPEISQLSTIRGRLSLSTSPESIIGRLLRLSVVALVKESSW